MCREVHSDIVKFLKMNWKQNSKTIKLLFYQFHYGFLLSVSYVGASSRENGKGKRLNFTTGELVKVRPLSLH